MGDMMYGIMAEKDVKLSSVVRALKEGITPKKVEDRLSRMLSSKGLERELHDAIATDKTRSRRYGSRTATLAKVPPPAKAIV